MKAFWKYTLARVGLFLVAYVAIWAATNAVSRQPVIDPFILLAAIIVSGGLSIFLLRGMREQVAEQVTRRTGPRDGQANRDTDDLD